MHDLDQNRNVISFVMAVASYMNWIAVWIFAENNNNFLSENIAIAQTSKHYRSEQ